MKTLKILTFSLLVAAMGTMLVSMTPQRQKAAEPWEVPARDSKMVNPVKADDASIKKGMTAYKKFCAACHGKTGLGDGFKARGLKTFPGDFSGEAYKGQTDGDHFYKIKEGRDEMPKYENKVPDNDMWHIVNYMHTFKK
jgi:mono/diheme cytochrome c family protein